MPDVISRKDAKAAGLTRYFTGKPCPKGHICERHTSGGGCSECLKEYRKSPVIAYWHNKLRRGRSRKVGNTLRASDVLSMLAAQLGKCALSNRVMTSNDRGPDCMSLDRIDHSFPYQLGNVRLLTNQVNTARGPWSDNQLIEMCRDVLTTAGWTVLPPVIADHDSVGM